LTQKALEMSRQNKEQFMGIKAIATRMFRELLKQIISTSAPSKKIT
jgi:hypothetical protein